ncbi:hypothetical protein AB0395_47865 [Streptosporangium sp. NPDC051023]|uniref:hypothetical protein n=1 Tax=Streptosporangium sp. NPDC051023 TaxID=3155410 RepID=UPI00344F0087
MKIRRLSAAALLAAALGTATLVGATPAAALPTGCRIIADNPYQGMVVGVCDGGTGQYRTYCIYYNPQGLPASNYGPWVSPTNSSVAWCPKTSRIGALFEFRD